MGIRTKGLWGHGNVLSDQDAVDVAEFFSHKPRADFPGKVNHWPTGRSPREPALTAAETLARQWTF